MGIDGCSPFGQDRPPLFTVHSTKTVQQDPYTLTQIHRDKEGRGREGEEGRGERDKVDGERDEGDGRRSVGK